MNCSFSMPFLRTAFLFVFTGGAVGLLCRAAEPLDADTLRVVVRTLSTNVTAQERFTIALRVENVSGATQALHMMSCSWYDHWQASTSDVAPMLWICTKNSRITSLIPPGGAYTNQLEMLVPERDVSGKVFFKMGFKPLNSLSTFWSDDVLLNVRPAEPGPHATADPDGAANARLERAIQAYYRFNQITNPVIVHVGMKVEEAIKILGEPTDDIWKHQRFIAKPDVQYEGWLHWYHNPINRHVAPFIRLRVEKGIVKELSAGRS